MQHLSYKRDVFHRKYVPFWKESEFSFSNRLKDFHHVLHESLLKANANCFHKLEKMVSGKKIHVLILSCVAEILELDFRYNLIPQYSPGKDYRSKS